MGRPKQIKVSGIEFPSIKEAAAHFGVNKGNAVRRLSSGCAMPQPADGSIRQFFRLSGHIPAYVPTIELVMAGHEIGRQFTREPDYSCSGGVWNDCKLQDIT